MKRKKIRAFLVLFPTVLILLACGLSGEEEVEEVVEEKPTIDYSNIPLDPYGCYRESQSWVDVRKGLYIYRDEKYYSLNNVTSLKDRPEYNVGEVHSKENDDPVIEENFLEYQRLFSIFTGPIMEQGFMSESAKFMYPLGCFPFMTYNPETDEMRSFEYSTLTLMAVEDAGYGFVVEGYGEDANSVMTVDGETSVRDPKDYKYVLNDGTEITEYSGLDYGTEVTVSWFTGTDYYEYKCVADTRLYRLKSNVYFPTYRIDGILNPEGYATYDLSDVEPGIYQVHLSNGDSYSTSHQEYLQGDGFIVIE